VPRHLVHVRECPCGQAATGVDAGEIALVPDHGEEVAADPAHMRVDDRQHEVRGDGRIDRIATLSEDAEAG
jgi:hypothetical protein